MYRLNWLDYTHTFNQFAFLFPVNLQIIAGISERRIPPSNGFSWKFSESSH